MKNKHLDEKQTFRVKGKIRNSRFAAKNIKIISQISGLNICF